MAKYFKQPSAISTQQRFSQVPSADIPRSTFDRSHGHKTTFDAGKLVPIFVDEVVPGDTFNLRATAFARLATMIRPIMDNLYLDIHFWFVPNRLVWENWTKFMGERPTPDFDPDTLSMPMTTLPVGNAATFPTSRWAYFGLPQCSSSLTPPMKVCALPFRAYNLIWNEWYRDENLQQPAYFTMDNSSDSNGASRGYGGLLPRGKRKDYFTGALPWPQKGDPVTIPIGQTADLVGLTDMTYELDNLYVEGNPRSGNEVIGATGVGYRHPFLSDRDTQSSVQTFDVRLPDGTVSATGADDVYVDLQTATSVTVNDLRMAFQVQKLLERDARGGTRYIELILSHFGVQSDDARLQRPEFLGGHSQRLNVNVVPSTAETTVPIGTLASYGTVVNNGSSFGKSFTEHGFIIGLASVRADLTYQQGIERFWTRKTRHEQYWPVLSHLGEQAISLKEIYVPSEGQSVSGYDGDEVFGYQERYAEYRYKPSRITGLLNSAAPASLDSWHLSQFFSSKPLLNSSFIEENPPVDRIVAVPSEPDFIADIWFDLKCTRPMPVYSVPGLIDHF